MSCHANIRSAHAGTCANAEICKGKAQMTAHVFDLDHCFPSDYETARRAFVAAAESAGASIETHLHPGLGPAGEVLATDVALLGSARANNVLVLVSGTHGVEGLPGSWLLVAQIRAGLRPAPRSDLAIMMVHALNPFGLAFQRRVNEDNVDINRNFTTFPAPLHNPEYDRLHDWLTMPPNGLGSLRRKMALGSYAVRNGSRSVQRAITKGQFAHPTGLFYGGTRPSWSRTTWDRIIAPLTDKRRVVVVDYHTGLGPRGRGQLISPLSLPAPGFSAGWSATAMTACFGADAVRNLQSRDVVSTEVSGDLLSYTMRRAGNTAAVVLEFGTYPALTVLEALINENWAHHANDARIERHRRQLVEAFSPLDSDWRRTIYQRAAAVSAAAMNSLLSA